MKKTLLPIASLLLLFTLPSKAQDFPRTEVFVGYSYALNEVLIPNEQSDLHGFDINAAYNFTSNFGVAFDFSGHFGNEDVVVPGPTPVTLDIGINNYTYLGGPRYVYRGFDRLVPFGHALFGVQNTRAVGISEVNFAWALGGGLDVKINDHFAIRAVQAEYLGVNFDDTIDFGTTNNFRASTGVVVTF